MSFIIDKTFDFCYGHRVYVQKLDATYSLDKLCKCRHLHGHQAKVQVFLEAEDLNTEGMVTDFNHLNWLKKFIDRNIDHKFLIDIRDPLFGSLTTGTLNHSHTAIMLNDGVELQMVPIGIPGLDEEVAYYLDTSSIYDTRKELLDSFVIIDFVPTSENLSRWLYGIVDKKMAELGVITSKIDWWETPKSRATYEG